MPKSQRCVKNKKAFAPIEAAPMSKSEHDGCYNCEVELDDNDGILCSPCHYLANYGTWTSSAQAFHAHRERLTNRRWQMRFARGEINA